MTIFLVMFLRNGDLACRIVTLRLCCWCCVYNCGGWPISFVWKVKSGMGLTALIFLQMTLQSQIYVLYKKCFCNNGHNDTINWGSKSKIAFSFMRTSSFSLISCCNKYLLKSTLQHFVVYWMLQESIYPKKFQCLFSGCKVIAFVVCVSQYFVYALRTTT